jgi:hypothetical protein
MTPSQIDRAKILRDALQRLDKVRAGNSHKDPTRRGLDLQVNAREVSYVTSMSVDYKTGCKIIAAAEKIIRAELRELGVRYPRRKKVANRRRKSR